MSVDFELGPSGEILRMSADRYRDVKGVGVRTPWVAELRGPAVWEGMRIPMAGEVAWLLSEGRLSYWRGCTERIAYDFEG